MPALTAQQALPLQLEAFSPYIARAIEADAELSRYLGNGNGGATKVSLRSFRARLLTAHAGAVAQFDLDNGSMPMGDGDQWNQFLLSPIAWTKPIQYSQLAQLVGEGENVATNNSVTETIQGVIETVQMYRDMFLQGPGDGSLASVDSLPGGNFINLRSTITATIDGRGAHLVKPQQKVQIMSNAAGGYVLRGSATIQQIFNSLGATQQIQVDAIPAGVVAGDLIIVDGAAPGAPQFINGIPFFVNSSTIGNVYGISRSLPYVVASGLNLSNTAQVTKPVFMIAENQIKQRLGKKGLKNQFYHTHPSQLQAYAELAFTDTVVPLPGGTAGKYDPMFREFAINGRMILENIHADSTRWDLLLKEAWNVIKWGPGMFWFKNRGGQSVFQVMDAATGGITVQEQMFYCVAEQWYVNSPMSQGGIQQAKVPQSN
jgi:hypothetical protein